MVVEVVVVGAGMAGLTAARGLAAAGHRVVVVDKGRAPGGRMASRRHRALGARFDTGAQFLTAKSVDFAAEMARWCEAGVAAEWFRGGPDGGSRRLGGAGAAPTTDGHPRYRGVDAMRAIPEHLAVGLDVRLATRVVALHGSAGGWRVEVEDAPDLRAAAVVLTAPSPQAADLLARGSGVPAGLDPPLSAITWDPAWAVLVRPDRPVDLPGPAGAAGALRLSDHPIEWVTDNLAKGVSSVPAVTLHASAARTRDLLDASPDEAGRQLLADASDLVTGEVVHAHRWRYSSPASAWHEPAVLATDPAPIVLAGDAFAGGRVEGAWTSGRAAATMLLDLLEH